VARQDEIIVEIREKAPLDVLLVQRINLSLKLRLTEGISPLRIKFTYHDADPHRHVQVYYSHSAKEPSAANNGGSQVNPACIVVDGAKLDKKSGKTQFEPEWLYLTVCSLNSDQNLRVTARFKDEYRARAKGKAPEGEGDQPRQVAFLDNNDLTFEHLKLDDCTAKEKRERIHFFIKKLQEDEMQWGKLQGRIKGIHEGRQQRRQASDHMKC